jgi:hypothetical protein
MNWTDPIRKLGDEVSDLVIDYLKDNVDPDDVFTDEQLAAWAEANGYTKEDEK